jgi:hypothetical protein
MTITHYEYLVLKMPSPNGIIKIHGDHTTDAFTSEKLYVLVVTQEVVVGFGELDQAPSISRRCISSSAPRMQPSNS